jgi:hypothetical protein
MYKLRHLIDKKLIKKVFKKASNGLTEEEQGLWLQIRTNKQVHWQRIIVVRRKNV